MILSTFYAADRNRCCRVPMLFKCYETNFPIIDYFCASHIQTISNQNIFTIVAKCIIVIIVMDIKINRDATFISPPKITTLINMISIDIPSSFIHEYVLGLWVPATASVHPWHQSLLTR